MHNRGVSLSEGFMEELFGCLVLKVHGFKADWRLADLLRPMLLKTRQVEASAKHLVSCKSRRGRPAWNSLASPLVRLFERLRDGGRSPWTTYFFPRRRVALEGSEYA